MRKILEYEQYHKMGSHCLTTCYTTLFKAKGYQLFEEMILGLGSGLGFTYVRQKDGFMYGGRGGNLEQNLASALGLELITNRTEDKEIAWKYNREKILEGHPLVCEVDMKYLPYMVEKLHTDGSGFSGHKLILIGFDDEANEAYVLDYLWNQVVTVSIDNFKKAASSSIKPMSPDNSSVITKIPEELLPMESAIYHAIGYNVNQMLNPVGFGLGLKAIKRFFKELKSWPDILDEDKLRYELNMAHLVFEKVGTGGGNFRRMYARFLKSSAVQLNNNELLEISKLYATLGKMWKQEAYQLYEASIDKTIKDNSIFLRGKEKGLGDQILELETEGIERLQRFVEGGRQCYQ